MASVIHATAHGLSIGDPFKFGNVLPTNSGIDEGTTYYVLAGGFTANDFTFSTTPGGTAFVLDYAITGGVLLDADTYTLVDSTEMPALPTLDAPTALTLSSAAVQDADGHWVVEVKAAYTPATTPGIIGVKVELATTASGPDWTTAKVLRAPLGTAFVRFVVPGNVGYSVRAASEDVYGRLSSYTAVGTHTATKDTTAPSTPTGLTATPGVLQVAFDWTANTEADLSHYEVQVDDNASFTSPVTIKQKSNTLVFGPVTAGTYYARVKAVDTSTNASAFTSSVNAVARLVATGDIDPTATIENATNLINGPATVTIDDDGLTIEDGALTLKDEFGETVMVASGFAGTWADFMGLGLYNGAFRAGNASTVPVGRTAALPYWTTANQVGSPVLTHMDPGVQVTFAALNNEKRLTSDSVAIIPGRVYEGKVAGSFARSAGTLTVVVDVLWFKSDGSASATVSSSLRTFSIAAGASALFEDVTVGGDDHAVQAPLDAYFAQVRVRVTESGTHHASNAVNITFVSLLPGTHDATELEVDEELYVGLGSGLSTVLTAYGDASIQGQLKVGASDTAVLDDSSGEFTTYSNNTWTSYTPTVGNIGSGTNSTAVGYYQKIGKMVFIIIYLVCNANGTGASNVSITTPSSPDRTTRQVIMGNAEGHGTNGAIELVALTGGSGATWDRVRFSTGGNMIGTDYDNGGIITLQGFYREA